MTTHKMCETYIDFINYDHANILCKEVLKSLLAIKTFNIINKETYKCINYCADIAIIVSDM